VADTSFVQAAKLAIIDFTGLSKDALHVYLGLAVWLLSVRCGASPSRPSNPGWWC
jgi:hypothetical protein